MQHRTSPAGRRPTWAMDLALVGVAASWGVNHVVVKHTLANMMPLAFNALRFGLASATLLGILWLVEGDVGVKRRDLWPVLGVGVLGHTVYQTLFITGLSFTTAGKTSVILAVSPVFVACLERLLGIGTYRWRAWVGVLASLAGVILITGGGRGGLTLSGGQLRGDLLVLAAAACWGGYTVAARPLLDRYSPLRVTALTMSAGTIPMILLSAPVLMAQDWGRVTATSWAALVYSYSVPIVVGYLVWSWGIQRIGSGRTAIYSNLSPLVASLLGWALLGERWSAPQVAGGLLIPLGIAQVRADGGVDRRIDARGQGGVGRWTRVDDRGPETGRRVL